MRKQLSCYGIESSSVGVWARIWRNWSLYIDSNKYNGMNIATPPSKAHKQRETHTNIHTEMYSVSVSVSLSTSFIQLQTLRLFLHMFIITFYKSQLWVSLSCMLFTILISVLSVQFMCFKLQFGLKISQWMKVCISYRSIGISAIPVIFI